MSVNTTPQHILYNALGWGWLRDVHTRQVLSRVRAVASARARDPPPNVIFTFVHIQQQITIPQKWSATFFIRYMQYEAYTS